MIMNTLENISTNVPIMVRNSFIGFEDYDPTECGIENFREVVEVAKKLGEKIDYTVGLFLNEIRLIKVC